MVMIVFVVLAAVNLNYEPIFEADKIDDESMSRCLAAKMKSLLAPTAKVIPNTQAMRRGARDGARA
jgi:preprotein translocase subunit SecB